MKAIVSLLCFFLSAQTAICMDQNPSCSLMAMFGELVSAPPTTKLQDGVFGHSFGVPVDWYDRFERVKPNGFGDFQVSLSDVEIAESQGRIFRFSKNEKIILPDGFYIWLHLPDGTSIFGRTEDRIELGVKHLHLTQGQSVVFAGELNSITRRFNLMSGGYMHSILGNDPIKAELYGLIATKFLSDRMGVSMEHTEDHDLFKLGPPQEFQFVNACTASKDHHISQLSLGRIVQNFYTLNRRMCASFGVP
ncbi:MAG: hypothetical protein K2X47_01310 [Bdellovibrionales bacterium]|nr:hypothetical protein [Bdellovibrionales bacterium]